MRRKYPMDKHSDLCHFEKRVSRLKTPCILTALFRQLMILSQALLTVGYMIMITFPGTTALWQNNFCRISSKLRKPGGQDCAFTGIPSIRYSSFLAASETITLRNTINSRTNHHFLSHQSDLLIWDSCRQSFNEPEILEFLQSIAMMALAMNKQDLAAS